MRIGIATVGYRGLGAVYLAAVLAGHTQKALPAFGIYGRDVKNAGDTEIPGDVKEKILRFAKAGVSVAAMKGKSYLSLGNVSMGIAGSIVDQNCFESFLGIRVEAVDMVEIVRRVERNVLDGEEFKRALAWVKASCNEGKEMMRVNLVKGLGPVLQLAEGWTAELPAKANQTLEDRTNPTWPTTWFAPRLTGKGAFVDGYTVMSAWGANHGSFSYGHVGADVLTMASMLRIPVFMHNVSEEKIFRPGAWNSFGTADLEGADFRACTNFGPLYGKKQGAGCLL